MPRTTSASSSSSADSFTDTINEHSCQSGTCSYQQRRKCAGLLRFVVCFFFCFFYFSDTCCLDILEIFLHLFLIRDLLMYLNHFQNTVLLLTWFARLIWFSSIYRCTSNKFEPDWVNHRFLIPRKALFVCCNVVLVAGEMLTKNIFCTSGFFSYLCLRHRFWVLVRTTMWFIHILYFERKNEICMPLRTPVFCIYSEVYTYEYKALLVTEKCMNLKDVSLILVALLW